MFIAMNRFKVRNGSEEAFEQVWKSRDSRLTEMKGFRDFHLLKGPANEAEGYTLYASHTVWATEDDFVAWTKSQNFRDAHRNAGNRGEAAPTYLAHPQFEGFSVVEGA
jgi:heme-degrading monooxygenase HmoA